MLELVEQAGLENRCTLTGTVGSNHIAALHERSLLRPPIPNAISGLVLRMNPRLHGEIAHAAAFDNDRSRAGMRADYMPAKPPYANFAWVQPCS